MLFSIVVLLFLCGAFAAAWLLCFAVWAVGKWQRKKWLARLGGVPLLGLSCGALGVVGFLAWSELRTLSPDLMFSDTFGVPSSDVTQIRSHVWDFGDTGSVYLKFQAAPATIARLAATTGLKPTPASGLTNGDLSFFQGSDTPSWWTPRILPRAHYFQAMNRLKQAASEEEVLVYDPAARTAYYAFMGID